MHALLAAEVQSEVGLSFFHRATDQHSPAGLMCKSRSIANKVSRHRRTGLSRRGAERMETASQQAENGAVFEARTGPIGRGETARHIRPFPLSL